MKQLQISNQFQIKHEGYERRANLVLYSNGNGKFFIFLRRTTTESGGIIFSYTNEYYHYHVLEKNITDISTADKTFNDYFEFYNGKNKLFNYKFYSFEECVKECEEQN